MFMHKVVVTEKKSTQKEINSSFIKDKETVQCTMKSWNKLILKLTT